MAMGMFPTQMNNMTPKLPVAPGVRPKWPNGLMAQGNNAIMAQGAPAMAGNATGTPSAPPPNPVPTPAPNPSPVPYSPNAMRDQVGGNIMGLLNGNNAAADQADRSAMTGISSMQKSADAGLQRQAATMGLQQGDPRLAAFMQQQNAQTQSMGSKLLSDNTQRRLDDQTKNLSTANTFLTGQQANDLDNAKLAENHNQFNSTFGENQRQFNTSQGASDKAATMKNLNDIINNPLSSEGQVEAAKQSLYATQGGLDPSLLGQKDKTDAQNQFNEIRDSLSVMNPGMDAATLDEMARGRMKTLDKSTFGALEGATNADQPAPDKYVNGHKVVEGVKGMVTKGPQPKQGGFDPIGNTGHAIAGGARTVKRFLGGLF